MMMRYIIAILFLMLSFSSNAIAQETFEGLVLAKAPIDRSDIDSIKRGAKFFASTCMICHTMVYMRYNKIAQEAGVTYDKMPINIKDWPYGVRPPDLSLEAEVRGVDWIYTYLHSFYVDKSRPTGVNNLVFPDTAMMNAVAPYQGIQELSQEKTPQGIIYSDTEWYDLLTLVQKGNMTPEQFDATITDLVNFLAYAAEPYRMEQERIGWWVLGFLVILFVMMLFLKREYWKDVKKQKD